MAIQVGQTVVSQETGLEGTVQRVLTNPACSFRTLVVRWSDGEEEEVPELDFGPLDD